MLEKIQALIAVFEVLNLSLAVKEQLRWPRSCDLRIYSANAWNDAAMMHSNTRQLTTYRVTCTTKRVTTYIILAVHDLIPETSHSPRIV